MNGTERRRFEMLLRVRDFGNTHRDLFSKSLVAQQVFAAVGAAIDELTATDMKKMSASVSARADGKAAARRALIDLLQKAAQLVKVLREEGRTMPPFDVPASKSDQALLTAGRQLAVDAASFDAEFSGHGMTPALMSATITAFEVAASDQGMSRADHVAARTRIPELLTAAMRQVRRLDLIVHHELPHDTVVRTVWKQARRLQGPRGPRSAGGAEPAPQAGGVEPAPEVA